MPIMMGLALGAAVGAGSAALQHKDILQGALIGGATGAITGGVGAGFGGAAASEGIGGLAGSTIANTATDAAAGVGASSLTGNAANVMVDPLTGLAQTSPSIINSGTVNAANPLTTAGIPAGTPTPTTGIQGLSGFDAFKADPMKYLGQNKLALAGAGLAGGMLASGQSQSNQNQDNQGQIRPYTFNQTQNPNYTGSGTPYFNQSMTAGTPYAAANGGVVGMANGGIAALANGGDAQAGALPLNQNSMYPMSNMSGGGAMQNSSGYETKTNPYTGTEVFNMAEGGIAAFDPYQALTLQSRITPSQRYFSDPNMQGGANVIGAAPPMIAPEVQAYNNRLMERANQQYNVNLPPNAMIVPGSQEDTRNQAIQATQAATQPAKVEPDWIEQHYQKYYGRGADGPGRGIVQQKFDEGWTPEYMQEIMQMQPEHLAYLKAHPEMTPSQPQQMQQDTSSLANNNSISGNANGGLMNSYARGGIANLGGYSDGGQLLKGPGDGVSDDIPAQIGAKQPARLADGEFVVPARIVSELGNGSTDAGAKRLYAMMDRVQANRKKTVGKGKVAVNSKSDKYLPA